MTERYYSKKYNKRIIRKQTLGIKRIFVLSVCILLVIFIFAFIVNRISNNRSSAVIEVRPIDVLTDYLEPNEYSRPQKRLKKVNGIVIHYTANPGSDALDNRNYFNNLPDINVGRDNLIYASSHYVIGLDGSIVQCIPLDEIAYASNERNKDTISIECCHPDETGMFTDATYDSLIRLTAWLCEQYNIGSDNILRHYDVTGKDCPRYYVRHKKKWEQLKDDVMQYINNLKV